ncbi:MAG: hypothetical protein ACKOCW_02825 [Planctomycetaceae bacterium]
MDQPSRPGPDTTDRADEPPRPYPADWLAMLVVNGLANREAIERARAAGGPVSAEESAAWFRSLHVARLRRLEAGERCRRRRRGG